jgi:hypothetical protein
VDSNSFWVVTAIMAAYSVYTIATMPKPNTGGAGSSNNELAARANQARVKAVFLIFMGWFALTPT